VKPPGSAQHPNSLSPDRERHFRAVGQKGDPFDRQARRIWQSGCESLAKDEILMLESAQSSVITKFSSRSVAEAVDRLKRFVADRGFTLFRVIDHSGTAEAVGVQMPDSETRHVWESD
jgi:hypothetical protein